MNTDSKPRGSTSATGPDMDENHDETRRDFAEQVAGMKPDTESGDSVCRDQNHDESRVNSFDPEVAEAIGVKPDEEQLGAAILSRAGAKHRHPT